MRVFRFPKLRVLLFKLYQLILPAGFSQPLGRTYKFLDKRKKGSKHFCLKQLEQRGFLELSPQPAAKAFEEAKALKYIPWKSGGNTEFAPLKSAEGEMECCNFSNYKRPDKDGKWTHQAPRCPELKQFIEQFGPRVGRARVIRLEGANFQDTLKELHRDNNNAYNPENEGWVVRVWWQLSDDPESCMILREDPYRSDTEERLSLKQGACFILDSERLYHAVWHPKTTPRYALIVSIESSVALEAWINSRLRIAA